MKHSNFLALQTSYCKYIQGYCNLTGPLTALLHKNTPFLFSTGCQDAFAGLKTAFSTAPCLAVPDMSEGSPEFDLVCDASGIGLGGVLLQSGRPAAFWSRKMVPAEQELLAVIEALRAFRCYVNGAHFNLITDHKPNTSLDTQPTLSQTPATVSGGSQRQHQGRANTVSPAVCQTDHQYEVGESDSLL